MVRVMFRADVLRGAVVGVVLAVPAVLALAGGQAASAAARTVRPLDPGQCRAIAQAVSQAVGIALATAVGQPDLPQVQGTACLMSGRASGLATDFDKVVQKLNASLVRAGWTAVPDFDADGLDSTLKGFARNT